MNKQEREQLLQQKLIDMSLYERKLYESGATFIGGVDEVGRGPLAGPVLAACVILPRDWDIPGLDDSKKLSEKRREQMYQIIEEKALSIGIGVVENNVIDDINILNATKQAMREACLKAEENLGEKIDHLLIDALEIEEIKTPQTGIIKGDSKSISVAAASIIAKVTRDNMMKEFALEYPEYGFESNKGYGTKKHYEGIEKKGICPIHRRTFLKNILD